MYSISQVQKRLGPSARYLLLLLLSSRGTMLCPGHEFSGHGRFAHVHPRLEMLEYGIKNAFRKIWHLLSYAVFGFPLKLNSYLVKYLGK